MYLKNKFHNKFSLNRLSFRLSVFHRLNVITTSGIQRLHVRVSNHHSHGPHPFGLHANLSQPSNFNLVTHSSVAKHTQLSSDQTGVSAGLNRV